MFLDAPLVRPGICNSSCCRWYATSCHKCSAVNGLPVLSLMKASVSKDVKERPCSSRADFSGPVAAMTCFKLLLLLESGTSLGVHESSSNSISDGDSSNRQRRPFHFNLAAGSVESLRCDQKQNPRPSFRSLTLPKKAGCPCQRKHNQHNIRSANDRATVSQETTVSGRPT